MAEQQPALARFGSLLFYLGGAVWLVYAVVKYMFGWDVTLRQFLPYHLICVIPGVLLKRFSKPLMKLWKKSAD